MQIRNALLNGPLGFGAAPLGNMFRNISDEEAAATVDAAWNQGTRYFDTAPFYGAGLSEIRLGRVLAKHKRNDYLLSTKVGRLILDEVDTEGRDFGEKSGLFEFGRPNKIVYDYSADGTKRSIDDSLKRLGVDRIDFVLVHDIAQDFHGDDWLAQFELARTGAFRALTQMREQGMIKAWGLGVNRVEPCELLLDLDETQPDGFLLAGRYTLLDHARALQRLMPTAAARRVDIVIGGPYSSGILAGGIHFEYQKAPPEIVARVDRIKTLATRYEVPIKAAALQFSLAHPASAAVIPGASRPERIAEDHAALRAIIPDDFWREMRDQALIAPDALLPIDRELTGQVEASASVDVAAAPDLVWRLIGGFGSLPDWQTSIPKSELSEGGRVRHLEDLRGETIVERLEAFDDAARTYSYSIVQAPFPISDYRSTLRVQQGAHGNGSRVEWSGRFTPNGVTTSEASRLVQSIFEDGLKALAIKLAEMKKP